MSSPTTTTTTAKTTVAANNTSKDIFYKVLVAIDGSDPSTDAADYAIYISEKYNSELYALNVMRVDFDLFGPTETPKHIIEMKKQAQEYLDKVKLKANEKIFK
jgi:nucleotide-binding universal stress UspA family protein